MKTKDLIKELSTLDPESDVFVTTYRDNGFNESYHSFDTIECFHKYENNTGTYTSKHGLVSIEVNDADIPEELGDIDSSGTRDGQ